MRTGLASHVCCAILFKAKILLDCGSELRICGEPIATPWSCCTGRDIFVTASRVPKYAHQTDLAEIVSKMTQVLIEGCCSIKHVLHLMNWMGSRKSESGLSLQLHSKQVYSHICNLSSIESYWLIEGCCTPEQAVHLMISCIIKNQNLVSCSGQTPNKYTLSHL